MAKKIEKIEKEFFTNLHEGHRNRLREKFVNAVEDGSVDDMLQPHELLELLLYNAIPRQNTNELAQKLMKEFGRLSDVVDADISRLMQVPGVGDKTAVLIKLISSMAKCYINEVNDIKNMRLTPLNIDGYIRNLFYGHTDEIAYLLFLDENCVVRKVKRLESGTVDETPIYSREIVKLVVNERYPYVMLAHNHPNSTSMPSAADMEVTKIIDKALTFINVRLVDHVIVAKDKVTSLARNFNFFKD